MMALAGGAGGERRGPHPQQYAEGPDVGGAMEGLPAQHLRRHVGHGAVAVCGAPPLLPDLLRQAEVADLRPAAPRLASGARSARPGRSTKEGCLGSLALPFAGKNLRCASGA